MKLRTHMYMLLLAHASETKYLYIELLILERFESLNASLTFSGKKKKYLYISFDFFILEGSDLSIPICL